MRPPGKFAEIANLGNVLPAPSRERTLLITVRQCLIMLLGALEDYLDMERSIVPKRKRG